ncbi:hypothetical protein RvY_05711 [Ramazzottius varieornatus]|uniref:Acyl carrier protein n=1 Tax=Ramazzottius varieornatus TaxID=947166 RepID=A0A1D1V2L7_RAMVA|nr:hypothetical protein RvY_05711 [Ramazzottius varieornatus]
MFASRVIRSAMKLTGARSFAIFAHPLPAGNAGTSYSSGIVSHSRFQIAPLTAVLRTYADYRPRVQVPEAEVRKRIMYICQNFDKITADKLTEESNFMSDLGLDSLDHVELIMGVEDEFGFEINDDDAEKLLTPNDIVKYVVKRQTPSDDPVTNLFTGQQGL